MQGSQQRKPSRAAQVGRLIKSPVYLSLVASLLFVSSLEWATKVDGETGLYGGSQISKGELEDLISADGTARTKELISRLMRENITKSDLEEGDGYNNQELASLAAALGEQHQQVGASGESLEQLLDQQNNARQLEYEPEAVKLRRLLGQWQNMDIGSSYISGPLGSYPLLPNGQIATIKRGVARLNRLASANGPYTSQVEYSKRPEAIRGSSLRFGDSLAVGNGQVSAVNQFGKRPSGNRYEFGLGKRVASPSYPRYDFGLGKRAPSRIRYDFGLGK